MKNRSTSLEFFEYVRKYLTEFMPRHRNLSENTIQANRDTLNLLLDYCVNQLGYSLLKIEVNTFLDIGVITGFLDWLQTERKCRNATINQRLSCIRSVFKYIAYEEITYTSIYGRLLAIPQRKVDKNKTIEFMSEDALKAILSCPNTKSKKGLRDCFYMSLMYDSAARNSEMLSIKMKNVTDNKIAPYVFVNGKGRKKRSIPLMQKTMDIYHLYVRGFHRNYNPDDYLFYVIHHGQKMKMSTDNVAKFINKYAEQARLICSNIPDKVHPHMFRRSRAMHLYRNGMPLPLLSEFLGHEDPETTLIYASADTEMKRRAIEKATINLDIDKEKAIPIWKDDDEMIRRLYGLK
ncbi:tyrosine-type recombinase/integrase [Bacillus benzoevorans]|uniref:Site-specific recombinase XerD n=1 Tax=Bacillus benzoevorans TaxID=1456 RepID=A0A7X0HW95_9BACI|nr:tyrosine-type recombinase/integrase [Bacillus benzoevorans]MBB6448028.1 site-specific recombinase XerD [Bacillus benzoevorans]